MKEDVEDAVEMGTDDISDMPNCFADIETDSDVDIGEPVDCEDKEKKGDSAQDIKESLETEIKKYTKEYLEELKKYSECPETIPDEPFKPEDLKKRNPEETKELRQQFFRDKLIAEWEKENNREWPTYPEDVYNERGELVKKKGWKYDAHHIQPLSMGGENKASNITPLRYDVHSDHKGIHALGTPYDKLEKLLQEEAKNV